MNKLRERLVQSEASLTGLQERVQSLIEENFTCSVCPEVVIRPAAGNCAHIFCSFCIETWIVRNAVCPLCMRQTLATSRITSLENFLTSAYTILPEAVKIQRRAALQERASDLLV